MARSDIIVIRIRITGSSGYQYTRGTWPSYMCTMRYREYNIDLVKPRSHASPAGVRAARAAAGAPSARASGGPGAWDPAAGAALRPLAYPHKNKIAAPCRAQIYSGVQQKRASSLDRHGAASSAAVVEAADCPRLLP